MAVIHKMIHDEKIHIQFFLNLLLCYARLVARSQNTAHEQKQQLVLANTDRKLGANLVGSEGRVVGVGIVGVFR